MPHKIPQILAEDRLAKENIKLAHEFGYITKEKKDELLRALQDDKCKEIEQSVLDHNKLHEESCQAMEEVILNYKQK